MPVWSLRYFILRSNYANLTLLIRRKQNGKRESRLSKMSFLNKASKGSSKEGNNNSELHIDATLQNVSSKISSILKEFKTQAKTRGIKLMVEEFLALMTNIQVHLAGCSSLNAGPVGGYFHCGPFILGSFFMI